MLTSKQNFSQPLKKNIGPHISLYHLVKCFVLCFADDTDHLTSSPQSELYPAKSRTRVLNIFFKLHSDFKEVLNRVSGSHLD